MTFRLAVIIIVVVFSLGYGVNIFSVASAQTRLVEEFPLKRIIVGLLALSLCCGCKRSAEEYPAATSPTKQTASSAPAAGQSVISGQVFFNGVAPAPRVFNVASDKACSIGNNEQRISEGVIVNRDGALKNAFVYIRAGFDDITFTPPSTPVVLDQRGCRFVPHVLGIQVGQPLRIVNSDNTFHNVHALAKANKAFNLGMTVKTPEAQRVFGAPEVMVPIRCNVHPWMGAYLGVVGHPFFSVSDSAGFFELRNLPAGHFTLEAWHEEFGKFSQNIAIGVSENKSIDFTFRTTQVDSDLQLDASLPRTIGRIIKMQK